ncbi:hypothetical protein H5187_23610 [Pseudoalteromonas sp. SG44-1]|uniref:hypothetical protein n=1 Tax=unclassified Pseudoalteromonas TaxID=194690 RepID=UPI001601C1A8|nr:MULTISPECIES: hypothetical protein [unclassified Pseudoalteromonas]MBB1420197.1 hypothetical protein [Pseudoalteromonas sp. SG44-1]MBB1482015.1 hypothetical protein [Pseudoalteromonas sp. SG41-2]
MKYGAWILLSILFFGLGLLKLNQDEISRIELIQKIGSIESVSCNSGSKDGSPTVVLKNEGGISSYKVLEEFSLRTNCDDKKQKLIGRSVIVSVLPSETNFAMAYEFILDGTKVYSLEDVVSSDKETAYALLIVALVMIGSLFFNRKKDT